MAPQPLQLGSRLDSYTITGILGTGGFGVTYDAVDEDLDRRVAIKEYFPDSLASRAEDDTTVHARSDDDAQSYAWGLSRFLDEARTLARFHSPHIVRVNRYLQANRTAYLVMDYEEGRPLDHYVSGRRRIGERPVRAFLEPVLRGLAQVHEAQFLHRDIKPGNIFIRLNGPPLLIDFGSARQALQNRAQQNLTVVLTPGYAPLEQYGDFGASSENQGPWTDLYALGATAFHCLLGRAPPDAVSRMQLSLTGQADPVRDLLAQPEAECTPALADIIDWMLQPVANQRPQTCAEVLDALQSLPDLAGDGPLWPHVDKPMPGQASPRSRSELPTVQLGPDEQASASRTGPPTGAPTGDQTGGPTLVVRPESTPTVLARPQDGATLSAPPREAAPPPAAEPSGPSADDMERATTLLADHLGPIARVLVRKRAASAGSRAELCAALEADIDDPRERERFRAAFMKG